MAVMSIRRSPTLSSWAIKVESYLLLLRRDELVDLLRTAGQSVSTIKHKPPEKIRQTLLALPRDILTMVLRERIRRLGKTWT